MAIKNEFKPQIAMHPGRMLADEIQSRKMTQKEFAGRIQVTEKNLSEILNGKASITPSIALSIESALGTPASIWMKLQSQYDEIIARNEEEQELADDIALLPQIPYCSIREVYPSLPDTREKVKRVYALRSFYCVSRLANIFENMGAFSFNEAAIEAVFHTSGLSAQGVNTVDTYGLAAWLRIGQQKAQGTTPVAYNKSLLKKAVGIIKHATQIKDPAAAWKEIRNALSNCGVIVALVPYIKKTFVTGAVFWLGDNPVIILNAKGKCWDTFIFTILHEIGHILLHDKRFSSISLENNRNVSSDAEKETQADQFASDALISEDTFSRLAEEYLSGQIPVANFAEQCGVGIDILMARLAYRGKIHWSQCMPYRRKIDIA